MALYKAGSQFNYHSAEALPRPNSMKQRAGLDFTQLAQAVLHLVAPPCIFLFTSSLLSFHVHFQVGAGVWLLTLLSLVPFYLACRSERHALEYRLDRTWPRLSQFLFFIAAVAGMLFGGLNYWYYGWPSYSLDGLRTYTDLDATDVPGQRLMDAGRVTFAENTRLVTDMAMSYTEGETYCVAPITTKQAGSQDIRTPGRVDLWAAGVGCCSPGQSNFHCGDFHSHKAKSGLRVVDETQLRFFRLAVQQAEAAYNLEVGQPMFFTWLEDADKTLENFFHLSFKNFVVANVYHMGFNTVCVLAFVVFFAGSAKDSGLAALDER